MQRSIPFKFTTAIGTDNQDHMEDFAYDLLEVDVEAKELFRP